MAVTITSYGEMEILLDDTHSLDQLKSTGLLLPTTSSGGSIAVSLETSSKSIVSPAVVLIDVKATTPGLYSFTIVLWAADAAGKPVVPVTTAAIQSVEVYVNSSITTVNVPIAAGSWPSLPPSSSFSIAVSANSNSITWMYGQAAFTGTYDITAVSSQVSSSTSWTTVLPTVGNVPAIILIGELGKQITADYVTYSDNTAGMTTYSLPGIPFSTMAAADGTGNGAAIIFKTHSIDSVYLASVEILITANQSGSCYFTAYLWTVAGSTPLEPVYVGDSSPIATGSVYISDASINQPVKVVFDTEVANWPYMQLSTAYAIVIEPDIAHNEANVLITWVPTSSSLLHTGDFTIVSFITEKAVTNNGTDIVGWNNPSTSIIGTIQLIGGRGANVYVTDTLSLALWAGLSISWSDELASTKVAAVFTADPTADTPLYAAILLVNVTTSRSFDLTAELWSVDPINLLPISKVSDADTLSATVQAPDEFIYSPSPPASASSVTVTPVEGQVLTLVNPVVIPVSFIIAIGSWPLLKADTPYALVVSCSNAGATNVDSEISWVYANDAPVRYNSGTFTFDGTATLAFDGSGFDNIDTKAMLSLELYGGDRNAILVDSLMNSTSLSTSTGPAIGDATINAAGSVALVIFNDPLTAVTLNRVDILVISTVSSLPMQVSLDLYYADSSTLLPSTMVPGAQTLKQVIATPATANTTFSVTFEIPEGAWTPLFAGPYAIVVSTSDKTDKVFVVLTKETIYQPSLVDVAGYTFCAARSGQVAAPWSNQALITVGNGIPMPAITLFGGSSQPVYLDNTEAITKYSSVLGSKIPSSANGGEIAIVFSTDGLDGNTVKLTTVTVVVSSNTAPASFTITADLWNAYKDLPSIPITLAPEITKVISFTTANVPISVTFIVTSWPQVSDGLYSFVL